MNWKNLKIVAIVVLLIVDLFFLSSLIQREHAANYYDKALIEELEKLFRESSLYVDPEFLEARIVSMPVYRGIFDAQDISKIGEKLAGAGFSQREEPGGFRFLRGMDELFIGNDFTLLYFSGDIYEKPSEKFSEGDYEKIGSDSMVTDAVRTAVASFFEETHLIQKNEREKHAYHYSMTDIYTDGDSYIAFIYQHFGKNNTENQLTMLIENGNVLAADGVFVVSPIEEKLSSECVGLMELLLSEKQALDADYRESGAVSREIRILDGVRYSYELYFDAAGEFYFVPVCGLIYRDGVEHCYNLISGKLIAS